MKKVLVVFVAGFLMAAGHLLAQGPPQPPLSENELIELLKSKQARASAGAVIEQRGVGFELNPEIEKQLRKAKATEEVIEAVKKQTPSARTERAKAMGYIVASPDEERDMRAIQDELNPDVAIQLTAEFAQKHPTSPLLTYVYALAASHYGQKGDVENLIAQCEKSLALKSDNLMSLIILAQTLPQPQSLRTGNLEKKLDQAEKYSNESLELIGKLKPRPDESEDQFKERKESYLRDLHSSLGMVHFQRAIQALVAPDAGELAKSEAEYELAIKVSGQPTQNDYYRLGEVREALKKPDAAIEAYTHCIELESGLGIKAYAEQRIAAIRKKSKG